MRRRRLLGIAAGRAAERVLGAAAAAVLLTSFVVGLLLVPPDATQGDAQRLMYVHVPAAWVAYLAFAVVFASSIAYLRSRSIRWDRLAHASAEIGVVFTAMTIALGSLWGRPVWGVWWTWDPRLTTTTILLLIYGGYLAVRRLSDEPGQRARWSAVVGIVGFADVPVVHLSVVWWRSLHQGPSVLRAGGPVIAPVMLVALLLGVAAFTLLYSYLLVLRLRLERLESRAAGEALARALDIQPRHERLLEAPRG